MVAGDSNEEPGACVCVPQVVRAGQFAVGKDSIHPVKCSAECPVSLRRYDPNGNLWLVLMEHVTY